MDSIPQSAPNYWEKASAFWAEIRSEWDSLIQENDIIGLIVLGEPTEVYIEILGIASEVESGETATPKAVKDAIEVLHSYITTNPGPATQRLQASQAEAYSR